MVDKRNTFDSGPAPADDIADVAAVWLARRDRGLSAAEEREFVAWRGADPRHDEEFSRLEAEWESFGFAKADPELAAMAQALDDRTRARPARRRRGAWVYALTAAAAAVAIAVTLFVRATRSADLETPALVASPTYQVVPSASHQLTLEDGSIVTLRGESEVASEITPGERRVRLVRGEAHFAVTKDPARPFVVSAGGVAVRAVGTAFNVRLDPTTVEVLVTEGKVRVNDTARDESLIEGSAPDGAEAPVLTAGQCIIVSVTPTAATAAPVTEMTPAGMEQALAWQSMRLVFNRTPLIEAVMAFNEHGSNRLVLADTKLHSRMLGGTFRADNVEGFVRLLELTADVRAERRSDGTIVLWPAP